MPDPYIWIGIVLGSAILYLGRSAVVIARRREDNEQALMNTITTVFLTIAMVIGWPLFVGVLLVAWLFGWVTIGSAKEAIRKHLKE